MRTSAEIIDMIHRSIGDGDKQGLRNTAALLKDLDVFPEVPTVHVAGTNGKGSTCALVSRVLTVAGYRTGLYSSPFLQIYNERIRLNGIAVSDQMIETYGNEVLDCAEKLKRNGIHCTPFELGTALAMSIFKGENTDIQVIETGMGGRLDPTNAIPTVSVCAITAIGLDHMQYLGNTLGEIAAEKAGIIKDHVPVICQPGVDEVQHVFRTAASVHKAPLTQLNTEMITDISIDQFSSSATFWTNEQVFRNMNISLAGEHQLMNALTALNILLKLREIGMNIPDSSIREGFATTFWPARLEWKDNILLDGAHNAHSVHSLRSYTDRVLKKKKIVLLSGVLTEKISPEMINELKLISATAVTVKPDNQRAMDANEYSQLLIQNGMYAYPVKSIHDGIRKAQELAGNDGIIIATGSLYFVGELRTILGLNP